MNRSIMAAAVAALLTAVPSLACTSVIVSGKVTPDGRPLMWKNRDTGSKENVVKFIPATDSTFSYVAIVNPGQRSSVPWIGTNSKGFCIMNTQSYNITAEKDEDDDNGGFMKKALMLCADMHDFEHYMDTLTRPWKCSANFGVIDAMGNAAYYETNSMEYFKYDVNDGKVAPEGYLVRTNFSFHGRPTDQGRGHVRYLEAERQMRIAAENNDFTPDFILNNLARDYCNPALGIDYRSPDYKGEWALEHDIIVRAKSTSSVVIQGVRAGENPGLTTMWTIVGYPGTTVAMPVWHDGGEEGLPRMVSPGENGLSPLAHHGYILKESLYCWKTDDMGEKKYFSWRLLSNSEGTGYLQQVLALEPEILSPYKEALEKWREAGEIDKEQLKALNEVADKRLETFIEDTK